MSDRLEIAAVLFDGITALDIVGPYEVLQRIPGATVTFVAREPGPKRTEKENLALVADRALHEMPHPDIVLIPGGFGTRVLVQDEPVLAWVRAAHEHSRWTTSVCTGSLVLAAAGILRGLEATTHWALTDQLSRHGAIPVADRRVVEQGKVITAAGVSAGIDMALTLAARIAGDDVAQAIQLGIEYDPQPPFIGGSPASAPAHIVELVRANVARVRLSGARRRAGGDPRNGRWRLLRTQRRRRATRVEPFTDADAVRARPVHRLRQLRSPRHLTRPSVSAWLWPTSVSRLRAPGPGGSAVSSCTFRVRRSARWWRA